MSQENVVLFTKAISRDEELAERVREVPPTVASWVQIACDAGFEFTESEFASAVEEALGHELNGDPVREYLDAQAQMDSAELAQRLMDFVAGGFPGTKRDWTDKWARLVARAWTDETLKNRLLENPGAVLKEHGIDIPPGMDVRVVESTDKTVYVRLPAKPALT